MIQEETIDSSYFALPDQTTDQASTTAWASPASHNGSPMSPSSKKRAIAETDNEIVWVGSDGTIYTQQEWDDMEAQRVAICAARRNGAKKMRSEIGAPEAGQ